MKIKSVLMYVLVIGSLQGCYCLDYEQINETPPLAVSNRKYFRIVNHTQNTYSNNALYVLSPVVRVADKKWYLLHEEYIEGNKLRPQIIPIKSIKAKETIDKLNNEKLILDNRNSGYDNEFFGCGIKPLDRITKYTTTFYSKYHREKVGRDRGFANNVYLLSLNGGKQKIFFGASDFRYFEITEEGTEPCTYKFVKWEIHPVFQGKENVRIDIYEDKVDIHPLDRARKMELIAWFDADEPKQKVELELAKLPIVALKRCR